MKKRGPKKVQLVYTEEKLKEIESKLLKYIEETDIPILAEFAYQNDIRRTTLYEFDCLSNAIKKCVTKKEAQLEKKALKNSINPSMAIFSLKQLGWKDKQEIVEKKTEVTIKREYEVD
jgi:hypothetical protein